MLLLAEVAPMDWPEAVSWVAAYAALAVIGYYFFKWLCSD